MSLLPSLLLLPLLLIRRLDEIVVAYIGAVFIAADVDVDVAVAAVAGDRQTFKVLLRTAAVGNRRIIIRLYKIQ